MRERTLTRLFLRFRARRDGRALARVFDAAAPELLGVAVHLVRDAHEAEDLVQATFVAAIERAEAFDAELELRPWLYGILWREAAKARRRAGRRPDVARLAAQASAEPLDELVDAELPEVVRAALERCSPRYQEVLAPLLCEGRTAGEIARELGRSPGTVRMQIHRGLEQLRRALPAALGASAAITLPTRGLAAVRAEVLAAGGVRSAALAGAIAVAGVGGIAMSKAMVAACGALTLAVGIGVVLSRGVEREARPLGTEELASTDETELPRPVVAGDARIAAQDPAGLTPSPATADARTTLAFLVLDADGDPVPAAEVAVWPRDDEERTERHLTDAGGKLRVESSHEPRELCVEVHAPERGESGVVSLDRARPTAVGEYELSLYTMGVLTGVVLGADDRPVSGAAVTATKRGTMFGGGQPRDAGPVLTDAEGRFRLELACAGGFTLGAERFGARTEPIDARPVAGEPTEVVLRFGGTSEVAGIVRTPDGEPAAGAVVHLWEVLDPAAAGEPGPQPTRLEATADPRGSFAFELYHGGNFRLLATSADHASSGPSSLALERGEDRTGLMLDLVAGAEIRGRVLDAGGAPVAGALVAAHVDDRAASAPTPPSPLGPAEGAFVATQASAPRALIDEAPPEWVYGFLQTTTDERGEFLLAPVRPGDVPYVVMCAPDPARHDAILRERGVLPGANDIVLVLTEERLRGGFVRGRVRLEGSDEAFEEIDSVESYERTPDGAWRHRGWRRLELENGEYYLEGLEIGREYALGVAFAPRLEYGSALPAPFVASVEGSRLDFVFPRARAVELRVDPSMLGTRPWKVELQLDTVHPVGARSIPIPLDRNGIAHVPLPAGTWLARRPGIDSDLREPLAFEVRAVEGLQVVHLR